ncbi:outer membrane beta-barrel protein [soil metagenome]
MSTRYSVAFTTLASGLLCSTGAFAQSLNTADANVAMFTRNRNVAVQDRPRPEYDALGIRTGSALIYPKLEVSGEYNDNIYATSSGEQSDEVLHVRPEIFAETTWSVNYLSAYVRGSLNRYRDNNTENTNEFAGGVTGRLDVTRLSSVAAGADYNSTFEPRTSSSSPSTAVEPIKYKTAQAYISGTYTSGRFRLSSRADVRNLDYEDGRTGAGAVIDQDNRDRTTTSLTGRIDYAISPDTAVFFQATGNKRDYDIASTALVPNRDSTGSEFLAGASFEAGHLARGEVSVGYIQQDFDEPTYQNASGLGARVQLEWFPSELTTVTGSVSRVIEDAVVPGVGAYLTTNTGLTVDHELLRNVILTGRLIYARDEYDDIDREDTRFGATLGGTYLLNRNVGVSVTASTLQTTSNGTNRDDDFTVNRLAVSLVTQF